MYAGGRRCLVVCVGVCVCVFVCLLLMCLSLLLTVPLLLFSVLSETFADCCCLFVLVAVAVTHDAWCCCLRSCCWWCVVLCVLMLPSWSIKKYCDFTFIGLFQPKSSHAIFRRKMTARVRVTV